MDFENIGRRMKIRREELGLSLAEVGSRIGTSASAVQRWENGYTPSLKTTKLQQIAKALQTDVEYLLDVQKEYTPLSDLQKSPDPAMGESFIEMKDDSMINARIWPGDKVYLVRCEEIEDGKLYAVVYEGSIIIRRIFSIGSAYKLVAENPSYPAITFDKVIPVGEAIAIFGGLK